MNAKHTATPWHYDGGDCCEITASTAHVSPHGHGCAQLVAIATVRADLNDGDDQHPDRGEAEAKANARIIVRAVNAHDELVAALQAAGAILDQLLNGQAMPDGDETDAALMAVNAALSKAEEA